jgi:hypothetical protein
MTQAKHKLKGSTSVGLKSKETLEEMYDFNMVKC